MPKTIYEQIEEHEAELEKPKGEENGEEAGEPKGGDEGKPEDAEGGDEGGEGKPPETGEAVAEPVEEEVVNPSAAAFAKLRREKREAAAAAAKLEQELAAVKQQPAKQQAEPTKDNPDPEPDKLADRTSWLEWKLRQNEREVSEFRAWKAKQEQETEHSRTVNEAVQEFNQIVNEYKKGNADFDNAMSFAEKRYAESLRILNPSLSDNQIRTAINQEVLKLAAIAAAKGLNPAEELYDMAIERFGYVKAEETTKKPDLKKIEENKKRSVSGIAAAGSSGKMPLTLEAISKMSNGEFANLDPALLRQLEEAS